MAEVGRNGVVPVLAAVAAVIGLACAGAAPGNVYYATGNDAVTPDGLHRVNWEPFKLSFVKPGADLARYNQVLIDPVSISYQRSSPMEGLGTSFALSSEGMQALKQMFHEIFAQELAKSANFTVASAPGPTVLSIQGSLVDLVMTTPSDGNLDPDETVIAASAGAVTLMLDARDSQTGEPLVRVGERRQVALGDGFTESNVVSKSGAVRELLLEWASALRRELDQFHALPEIPASAP